MISEINLKVTGRVQGVRFRAGVFRKAKSMNLFGHVLNNSDGSVEIVLQGQKKVINNFLSWVQSSPGFSRVKGVEYIWRKPIRKYNSFSIVRSKPFLIDQAGSFASFFKSFLNKDKKLAIPKHVAIIPDGNRRWAKLRGLDGEFGHYTAASTQHLRSLINQAKNLGVKYLSFWAFSTENWKRSEKEVNALFTLLGETLKDLEQEFLNNKIRFIFIGRRDRIPKDLLKKLEALENKTKKYDSFILNLCLDYGGTDELVRAIKKISKGKNTKIDENTIMNHLDTAKLPGVDLVIRTSGEKRLSGFMPLQTAYAEFYFTDTHFPDFQARDLRRAIEEYSKRQRRYGR